ncbi:MAG: hypothetical protein NTX97_07285 [Bacteroidetes bacterium]|nr:hypothetical protein [Bacteroidota bacterium]
MKSIIVLLFSLFLILPCNGQTDIVKSNSKIGITFSLPWINYYHYVDYYHNKTNKAFGFFGLGISAYYKNEYGKFSFNVSTTDDLASPVSTNSYSQKDSRTNIGCSYFELIFHRAIRDDINLVTGFNFTNYNFHFESKSDSILSYKKVDQTLGFSIGLEYRFNKYYSFAAMYRPAIASFETDAKYRHLINFELRIDLDLIKRKQMI